MGARVVLLLGLVPGCGRLGFDAAAPAGLIDGAGSSDTLAVGDAQVDAATGSAPPPSGSYTIVQTTAPYSALNGQPVPGFAVNADDENYTIGLPFTFSFYKQPFTSVTVSVNGYVTFGTPVTATADTEDNDCPLDATTPDTMIAVFWDDLWAPNTAPLGAISYAITGTSPDRQLAIEWKNMDAYYNAGNGPNAFTQGISVTQTLVLHETGVIEMHYGPRTPPAYSNKDCGADRHRGCSATVGLEAPGNATFDTVQCATPTKQLGYTPIDEGRLITFTPS